MDVREEKGRRRANELSIRTTKSLREVRSVSGGTSEQSELYMQPGAHAHPTSHNGDELNKTTGDVLVPVGYVCMYVYVGARIGTSEGGFV